MDVVGIVIKTVLDYYNSTLEEIKVTPGGQRSENADVMPYMINRYTPINCSSYLNHRMGYLHPKGFYEKVNRIDITPTIKEDIEVIDEWIRIRLESKEWQDFKFEQQTNERTTNTTS